MPRSSGTYSPPAGQPVVTSTTISSTVHNALIADLGNEITNSIPRDGTAPPTANLPMGNFKHTGCADGTVDTDSATYGQIGTVLAIKAHAATDKPIPVDADEILLLDSAASFALKKLSWANLKAVLFGNIQNQSATAFTTTGSGTAFVGTPSPAITANTENQAFIVEPHTNPTGSPTLAVSGLTALNCKYVDANGVKQFITAKQVKSGNKYKVTNDGTDYVWSDLIPSFIQSYTRSAVHVTLANGYGSTNTAIRRFTTVNVNTGSDITYADSATLGASFTINNDGWYTVNYFGTMNTTNAFFGVSLNSTQLNISIAAITLIDRLSIGQFYVANAIQNANVSPRFYSAGDVIRAHDDTTASGASNVHSFRIERVG
jgi:hypothetical protein